ncbi:MAG TPA: glucoamylase family protein [Steroidobacteraceae bacterium]|nr:glucoamylase family protein [Steroidobacteraceae bacterium]
MELFEDFPSHSEVAAARSHRWMRGDWQLLPWIFGLRGRLPPLGRWKMIDNLRRSLVAPCSLALLVAAFADRASHPWVWLLLVLCPALWPALATAFGRLAQAPGARSRRMHLYHLMADLGDDLVRAAVSLAMLAQNTWLGVDAIARALFRLAVSRRHLLEWTTAAQLKFVRSDALSSFVWPLKSASIVVVAAVAVLLAVNPPAIMRFAPLLLVWWLSPILARFLSRPLDKPDHELPPEVDLELRGTARLTWTFFEQFVTAEDNFLPPDNFQEDPVPVVAHRSSPTNMGLYLLATVAARDFGWLGLKEMTDRLTQTFATLQQLERFEGHLLNWYETRTLRPLEPRYVSTVDSGNLAGHLLALRQACIEMRVGPLLSARAFAGPADAIDNALRELELAPAPDRAGNTYPALRGALRSLHQRLLAESPTLSRAAHFLRSVRAELLALAEERPDALPATVRRWLLLAARDLGSHLQDLDQLLPEQAPRRGPAPSRLASLEDVANYWEQQAGATCAPARRCHELCNALDDVAAQCLQFVSRMSFGFLFDRSRGLFSIGFRVADRALDPGYYDLLASEARLASLVAIAKGDVPRSHWFRLGRRLTGGPRRPTLASWSGSMFEYLMPSLVMHDPPYSLLEQTNRRVVALHMRYAEHHDLPWGVSESAYNVRDREYTYQYSGFGVPALGLKRGLAADQVVAPYATALAAMVQPLEASENFHALERLAARGEYGFYEALDFTESRLPEGRGVAIVRAYMAHHQGMTLVALDNVLQDFRMQARFHADPRIAAADLLLQERCLRFVEAPALVEADVPVTHEHEESQDIARVIEGVDAPTPVTHLLSNRSYTVMLTDSGAGYSSCRGRAVTRWREDVTRDCWGSFIYLYDLDQRRLWSAGFQPTAAAADEYRVYFDEECAVYARRDGTLQTTMTVVVTPDDDGELRRVTLRNDGARPRHVELTSYAEIVLAPQRADVAHPAFSNLFVQTGLMAETGALLATRRPRSDREPAVWAVHVVAGVGITPQDLQHETDRARFIGRGHDNRTPQALEGGRSLSGTVGNVLDPVFSLRTRVTVPPRGTATVTFGTFVAGTREQACALAIKYRTAALFEHVRESAWTFARSELYYLRSSLSEARLFQTLASNLLLGTRQLRSARETYESALDVTHLWRFSISGDLPILLIRCHSQDDIPFVQQCLRAQEYLRIKHFVIDVVILNEQRHSYVQDLQQAIERTSRAFTTQPVEGEVRGGIFPLAFDAMSEGERRLLFSLARVVLSPTQGNLQELLSRPAVTRSAGPVAPGPVVPLTLPSPDPAQGPQELEFFNGLGGFDPQSGEYVIALPRSSGTPAPWSNVLANEQFGSLVTERGSMCTWSLNSRENQLTAWSNDVVSDPSGECFYLVDEDGALWSPTAQPIQRADARYVTRHGQGFTRFLTSFRDFETELTVFVAASDPVKVCHLRITHRGAAARRLRFVSYVEWSLGASRSASNHSVQTRMDAATGAQFASNPPLIDFGSRIAFCDLGGRQQFCTDSRQEFLGRNGRTANPAGILAPQAWTQGGGPGGDCCCAFATTLDLAPGATAELIFVIGQAENEALARELVLRYRAARPEALLQEVTARWNRLLGAVRIRTPDRALDLLFNHWLLYQTISCRLWGRAAFYQCGGAYGFRDQLQDVMAFMLSGPEYARAHILRAAARQYLEGDAQHWWHPPSGRGVRTHISDDRIWLPFVVHHYLETTRDLAILDEVVPFIEGPPLPLHQEDAHYIPQVADASGSLYEHCARALDCSLATGAHGLPLMGGGDWNDGMNRVGHEGRGESIWLAWFLMTTLRRFTPFALQRGDKERASRWEAHLKQLAAACDRDGWDGAWYRRAFFDDGTPLGSQQNAECRIDSIAQSWAVLSGAGDPARAQAAMDAVEKELIRDPEGLVLLFTPPFNGIAPQDPGYIRGYLPGLRENGGQYTHAAIWVLMAEAMLGREAQVGRLLKMLNPVHRSASPDSVARYRVEPYVLSADIYSGEEIAQRGGWTWYTGAAGWMYRAVLEHVLGLRISGDTLRLTPCIPDDWDGFEVTLALPGIDCQVEVRRSPGTAAQWLLDGAPVAGDTITLVRDNRPHRVELKLAQALVLDK